MPEIAEALVTVGEIVDRIKYIVRTRGVTRSSLNEAKQELEHLARRSELWSARNYPDPAPSVSTSFYLVHRDAETGISLYINVMRPGERTPTHNHTTWACIASVDGEETNYLFERTDDRSQPDTATLVSKGVWSVVPGNPIGILPDDVHYVTNNSEVIVRHLHLYGKDVTDLKRRLMFDIHAGTYTVMPLVAVDKLPVDPAKA